MAENTNNHQDCAFAKDLLLEELQEGDFNQESLEIFSMKHPDCKAELESFYDSWTSLQSLDTPEPSMNMDVGFYKQLNEVQATMATKKDENKEESKVEHEPTALKISHRNIRFLKRIAIAASLFIGGLVSSNYFFPDGNNGPGLVDNNETPNLIYASSSIDRLEHISKMKEAPELSDRIIDALNTALTEDPNINVRLSAIEAMLHYADNPKVRANLISAIPFQDSPIIQFTLAEVMIELEEKESKDAWNKLLNSDSVEPDVKQQLERTLEPVLKL